VSVVVDASLVVALVVTDERQQAVRTHLAAWLDAGEELHAPGVLAYEVANVLARLIFDGALEDDDVTEIWRDIADLGLVLHPFDLIRDGAEVAAVTARLRRRHATDSSYVRLAQRLEAMMCTLDDALARNAADVGLPVRLVS
jgi:predicted nucleic acid-binding protein